MAYQAPPPDITRYWYPEIWDFVQRVRYAYRLVPFQVTSWWRDQAQNRLVGGNQYSQHLIATGIDAVPLPGYDKATLAQAFRQAGLIAVDTYPQHIHAQLYPAGFLERWLRG